MELFELVLLLLACVAVSAVLDQMISRVSLPLLQIAVGFAAAIALPYLAEIHLDSELFLMLFIAPLLFHEARESDRRLLWSNKWSVLSMAIALVIASVLAGGFVLHLIIPSIPLAAAFACAAALGPTDAAAVGALGQTISLTARQSTLLSGEALINDASGVVSFQFATAAAVTGAFSMADAGSSFAILFFGGIAIGMLLGFLAKYTMRWLRKRGFVSTTIHVIYEVLSPFLFFLAAEELHLSGILAVVAAGLVMQDPAGRLTSPERSRHEMVSAGFWEVIVFLINGVIFVMLGMQLPKVMNPDAMGGIAPSIVIGAMLAVTATITVLRFLWITGLELIHRNPDTGQRGIASPGQTARDALVTTIAGPKGAVTISIIMTLPLFVGGVSPFPKRDLIIFLTSGVVLCTLLLADFLLPRLAPKTEGQDEQRHLDEARIQAHQGVVQELRKKLDEYPNDEFSPALRMALMRYRTRLVRERLAMEGCGQVMKELIHEVLDVQQKRADEVRAEAEKNDAPGTALQDFSLLPAIRASVGYFDGAEHIGTKYKPRKSRHVLNMIHFKRQNLDEEQESEMYYDTCLLAIDMEHAALDYLAEVKNEEDETRSRIAGVLQEEHETALESLWGRLNYGKNQPKGLRGAVGEDLRRARHYADDASAYALELELDQIRLMRTSGELSEHEARALREEVYLLQTSLME